MQNKMSDKNPKIIVIVGPTASGKTSLSIDLSKRFNGEIISADSRQVYRGLDLGSGKVTKEEMSGITHHLLDVADPQSVYTASDFVRDGKIALNDILSRKKLPIIAGGTFFYIDALLEKISLSEAPPNPELRAKLEKLSLEELFTKLQAEDIERASAIDKANKRRLIRALEMIEAIGKVPPNQQTSPYNTLTIGIEVDITTHDQIIRQRIIDRLEQGMVAEVEGLLVDGVTHDRLEELGLEYRYISQYLRQLITYEEMIDTLTVKTRQFAKRQLTWLKRDNGIKWFKKDDENVFEVVERWLAQ